RHCLRRRLQVLHASLPNGEPVTLLVHARGTASPRPGDALVVDWTPHFPNRTASPAAWAAMSTSARDLAQPIRTYCPGRDVLATGTPGMPAALLLGSAFPTRDGAQLSWKQRQPNGAHSAPWTVRSAPDSTQAEESGWQTRVASHDPGASAC